MIVRVMSLSAVLFALCTAACTSSAGLDIQTWRQADVDTGARQVRVVDGEGRRESVARAQDDAFDALGESGFYTAVDDTNATLGVDADGVHLDNDTLAKDALYLRLDVAEDYAEISQEARDGTDEDGNPVTVIVDVTHAHALVDATLVRGDGAVLLNRFEVEGIHDEDGDDDESARVDAMHDAVAAVVEKITPTRNEDFVPFDDRDEKERPILDEAQEGDVTRALTDETAYIAAHATLAAPRYNRAVMRDAEGDFDAALAGYDDALSHSPDATLRAMIEEARKGCVARRDTARALGT